jgi:hypothetical protein
MRFGYAAQFADRFLNTQVHDTRQRYIDTSGEDLSNAGYGRSRTRPVCTVVDVRTNAPCPLVPRSCCVTALSSLFTALRRSPFAT